MDENRISAGRKSERNQQKTLIKITFYSLESFIEK